MVDRMIENKKLALAVADQRLATLGLADNLDQYCAKRRRTIHLKLVSLTVLMALIQAAILAPMIYFKLWFLASISGLGLGGYAMLVYRISCSYVDKQLILESLRSSQEERRGSIPPPPRRPPPVLTDYSFPSIDGKRGSLVNWEAILPLGPKV
ncbi:hypothetical protein L0F63_005262 [Massospora cicadina]|nr:hypothetical protein L0F63_005262 [Massospora cicadina]